ncbi:T9SS type A sorting domain-containing protein [Hymenobacter taeanensis]|uniref:T9SS type A sorting domain-containing protein n=1 Tax=Hymenobacter taeanensis TaxID=2735321 RepID=A0A6M6BEU3_9BACT|nr:MULTISPECIES: T9SS type A sorting domain-containing protein [Hymenobacter]QJX46264.1 T9SS type A sorting domain-containing protein [Hymenobacter taeanensis]UOQ80118.1 T9SS type A sorting domain-containing protein [Hymenobacter sp. 5414T-23]
MKKLYAGCLSLGIGALLLGTATNGLAQHIFTDDTLTPYKQNFDGLPATVAFRNNLTLPGVYALAEADAGVMPAGYPTTYTPTTIAANDGSNVAADYFHFGTEGSTDRAFGGIASTQIVSATGYVGIRFRNSSSVTIRNLEIQYAMEQWYNSGRQDQAQVGVSYLKAAVGDTIAALNRDAGTWTPIPALTVEAPSTATVVSSRDGNAPSNRRVRQVTLDDIALLPGQEIMIRWEYVLNSSTNGNGLSIDDVVITPIANSFFLAATQTGSLSSWKSNADGTGTSPASFTADNQTFYLVGNNVDASALAVSGANSKVVVGTLSKPTSLTIANNTLIQTPIDVTAGSTLLIREAAATAPATFRLGALAPNSTVAYVGNQAEQTVLPANYGHLRLAGQAPKTLGGNIIIDGSLTLDGAQLRLHQYNATLNRGARLRQTHPTNYVVTDGSGQLRQTVSSDDQPVLFPVGTAQVYLPVTLRQSKPRSEDVFQVRVADQAYAHYDAQEYGVGAALTHRVVQKTWFVSEEVAGNSDVSMTLQWPTAATTADFDPARAFVAHYHNGNWDQTAASLGAAGTGPFSATRTGITSFSPFGVTAQAIALPTTAATSQPLVTVVPNPSSGRFELVTTSATHTALQGVVLDALGREVLRITQPTGSQRTTFDLSRQPAGLYLFRLSGETPQTLRIVKQ